MIKKDDIFAVREKRPQACDIHLGLTLTLGASRPPPASGGGSEAMDFSLETNSQYLILLEDI